MLLFNMATSPFSKFQWKLENLNISMDIIVISILSYSIVTSLLLESLLPNISIAVSEFTKIHHQLGSVLFVIVLLILKIVAVIIFFKAHDQTEHGLQLVNFQLGFNQILIFIAMIWLGVVIFYLNFLQFGIFIVLWIYGIFWAFRLYGTILFLLLKFNYSVVTIFTYLCAFEIMPYILVSRIVFMIN